MNDAPWTPCGLCRSANHRVHHDHWQSFPTEPELEAHLREHLTIAQKEQGIADQALQQWRLQERFRKYEREACRDPMRSVEKLFASQFGKRTNHEAR